MAMATNPRSKSRRCRNQIIYETYEHKKEIQNLGHQHIYDDYGQGPQPHIQKIVKSKHLSNLSPLKNTTSSEPGTDKYLRWLWPPTNKTNPMPNTYETHEHLKRTTQSEPGTEKYLRWLWPPIHKTNLEDLEIQTFMKPMKIQK